MLPWHFEAFREYVSYQVLMAAAAVLYQFEGEVIFSSNPRIQQMQKLLALRTNKYTWIPNRTGSEDVDWSVEGDLYRNKGRLLTSMLIVEPKDAHNPPIVKLLPFGRSLAKGEITENQFYDFIITRFCYPHPAWEENWNEWTNAGRTLYPLAYILQVLIHLDEKKPSAAFLSTDEVARYLYPVSNHAQVKEEVKNILDSRLVTQLPPRERSDQVDRKINDILGFLCISGYCYYLPGRNLVGLNLRSRHSQELTMFERSRNGQNHLEKIKNLVKNIS